MDLQQLKKITKDKIEADTYTKIVRQNIKRNIRERQNAREAFKEAFEVLLESQGTSTKTQNAMLKELKKLNQRMQQNVNNGYDKRIEASEASEDERSEASEGELSRPHMRIPELLYQGFKGSFSRVEPSTITSLIRKGLIGTFGIASAIAATNYLGDQLSESTGNERYGTSADTFEPNKNVLKDNLYKLSTETALTIYNQAKVKPDSGVSGLSDLIYKGIIGSAGTNAAIAAYRLIADRLSPDSTFQSINTIKRGLLKPFQGIKKKLPELTSRDVFPTAVQPVSQPVQPFQPVSQPVQPVQAKQDYSSLTSRDVFPPVSQPVSPQQKNLGFLSSRDVFPPDVLLSSNDIFPSQQYVCICCFTTCSTCFRTCYKFASHL